MEENKFDHDLLEIANELLIRFGRKPYVKSIDDCDHCYFVDVYEAMVGDPLSGILISNEVVDQVQNVQKVIDALSSDVLGIDISHVNAQMIVNNDCEGIYCLLEIFNGLLEFILEEVNQDVEIELQEAQTAVDNSMDSNKLDDTHEILSDVLTEEFGDSYHKKDLVRKVKISSKNPPSSTSGKTNQKALGDSITWNSGKNNHTVSWSDARVNGERSPSGDSTSTDYLISLSQSTGNSTDELIREAQTVQKELEESRSSFGNPRDQNSKLDNSVPFASQWSTILSTSGVEPFKEEEKIEKKFAFLKEKASVPSKPIKHLQQDSNSQNQTIDLQRPSITDLSADSLQMTGTVDLTYSIDSDSTSMKDISDQDSPPQRHPKKFSRGRKNERKLDKKEEKRKSPRKASEHKTKSAMLDQGNKKPVVCNSGITLVSISKNGSSSTKTTNHEKMSGLNDTSKDVAVLKSSSGFEKKSLSKKGINDKKDSKEVEKIQKKTAALKKKFSSKNLLSTEINCNNEATKASLNDASILYHEEGRGNDAKISAKVNVIDEQQKSRIQTNVDISKNSSDSRTQQLFDLSTRLKKLREQVQPNISTRNTIEEDTTYVAKNTIEGVSHQISTGNKDKKEKGKVSFNFDSLLEEYHYSMSDTEVDYSSPSVLSKSTMKGSFRQRMTGNAGRGHSQGRKSPIQQRSILRTTSKVSNSITSADESSCNPENVSAKFEKPFLQRDERLRKLKKGLRVEEKKNKMEVRQLRNQYSKHHGQLKDQKKMIKKQSNLLAKECNEKEKVIQMFNSNSSVNSPCLKKGPVDKYAAKLSLLYGLPKKEPQSPTKKGRKRSASTSPVVRRKYKTPLVLEEHEILPVMEDEFPFLHLSPHSAKLMWQKQLKQISNLSKHTKPHKTSKIQRAIEDAQRKQKALADVMKKEVEHNRRLKELKERKDEDTVVRRNLHERRQRSARARKYYNDFAVQNKARMLKKRTKEEKIFKQLFEDGLDIQKQRIKEMRDYAREQKEKNALRQQNEIESLENYYKDKFTCLAESVAQEKYDLEVRQKAQSQVLDKMRQGMRKRMEEDLKNIQEQLQNDEDAYYFRQLDADVLKKEFQLATYKASKYK